MKTTVTVTETLYAGGKIKTGNELATLQLEVNRIKGLMSFLNECVSSDYLLLQNNNLYLLTYTIHLKPLFTFVSSLINLYKNKLHSIYVYVNVFLFDF